ncbi:MAG: Y-family DNA polymerase [Planctomycetota bacterium]|nr:MAG: Y-family DNA polymerase [Planctomycetota bacterium]
MFGLVDCNNFYVSCERVFQPWLKNRPVVVLSNNDGCVVARSQEVKDLGIPMGVPFFKIKDIVNKYNIHYFSSNYTLYADMSSRVMEILKEMAPKVEVYSIDEAFLDLRGIPEHKLLEFGCQLKRRIWQWTGIPVSIGFGPTKTLAKVATHFAKKRQSCCQDQGLEKVGREACEAANSVYLLCDLRKIRNCLENLKIGDIWGIGRQYERKLQARGIHNAWQFREAPSGWIKKEFTVMGLRTQLELRGIPCYEVEIMPPSPKSIISSRSFGKGVTAKRELEEAMVQYLSVASQKLRRKEHLAKYLTIFLASTTFEKGGFRSWSTTHILYQPTASIVELVKEGKKALGEIYRPYETYRKVGVVLTGLVPEKGLQRNLWEEAYSQKRDKKLMKVLDKINERWGKNTLYLASSGLGGKGASLPWQMRRSHLSPRYTTSWKELLAVKA